MIIIIMIFITSTRNLNMLTQINDNSIIILLLGLCYAAYKQILNREKDKKLCKIKMQKF